MSNTKPNFLNRYTSIADMLCILESKKLYLSNPESWTDKTDKEFLKKYAGEKARALCFFTGTEQNLYWECYAKYGCKIEFNKELLLNQIPENSGFSHKEITYLKLKEKSKIDFENLPFFKQFRYKNEQEYRVVWKGSDEKKAFIPIDLKAIKRITISGKVAKRQVDSLKKIIGEICDNELKNKIVHSTLFNSKILINKTKNMIELVEDEN